MKLKFEKTHYFAWDRLDKMFRGSRHDPKVIQYGVVSPTRCNYNRHKLLYDRYMRHLEDARSQTGELKDE